MSREANEEPDYYEILGISPDASQSEITAAFYSRARDHHPDTSTKRDHQSRQFKMLVTAYEALSNAGRRREYDRRGKHSASKQIPVAPGPDIRAELPISPEEARLGGLCEVRITYQQSPSGDHTISNFATETVQFRIPRNVGEGFVLSLPGHGHATGAPTTQRGVLHLRITIRPYW